MRHIEKTIEPNAIAEWKEKNKDLRVNLDYASFQRKSELRIELVAEQFGICAYTGMPVDDRLGSFNDSNLAYSCHNEHIKPRKVCEDECNATHGPNSYGTVICEDMDYRNLVAAVLASGVKVKGERRLKTEIFGAAAHGDEILKVYPTQPDCEQKFSYDDLGGVNQRDADDADTKETINLLKLNHTTLAGYRCAAIQAFFPIDIELDRDEVEQIIEKVTQPTDGRLPEFGFCIASYARSLL